MGPGEVAIPETIQLVPIDETFSHRVGDVAPDLKLDAQFRASATIYNQDQLRIMVVRLWNPTLQPGFGLREDSVDVGTPTLVDVKTGHVTFDVPIRGVATKSLNVDRIAAYARLRSVPSIQQELEKDFDLASPPTVSIVPAWLGRAFRVEVDVDTTPALPMTEPDRVHS
jgi:hypothetical protein